MECQDNKKFYARLKFEDLKFVCAQLLQSVPDSVMASWRHFWLDGGNSGKACRRDPERQTLTMSCRIPSPCEQQLCNLELAS